MSVQQYSKFQLKWYRCGYGCIVKSIQEKLQASNDDGITLKLLWRLGLNEYRSGHYDASIRTLEKLLVMVENSEDLAGNKLKRKTTIFEVNLRSTIHQIIGRAASRKFLDEKSHNNLELAYQHYQCAVDCMIVSLSAMIELPNLFVEFGVVLELYGAFEAAMAIYSKVLTRFPTCRAYFTALYRSAIVGRHLGSISNEPIYQQEVIEKSIDVLQFLLEALPSNIQDVSYQKFRHKWT
jgi:tetratricopeptide (TPR) repeat protein